MIVALLLATSILAVTALVAANGDRRALADAAVLAPAAGFGVLSLAFFAWRFPLGGSGPSFGMIAWVLVALAAAVGVRRWIARRPAAPSARTRARLPAVLLITAGAVLLVAVIAGWLLTRRHPVGQFDGWAIWSSRARLLYLSPDLTTVFESLRRSHPDYPFFLPGTLATQFSMVGGVSDWIPFWTGATFLVATAAAVALGVRRLGAPLEWAGAASVLLLATPLFTFWGFAQCADVPLAYLLTLAALALALLTERAGDAPFGASTAGFLTGLLAWTKNEGMILSLLLIGLYALFAMRSSGGRKRLAVVAAAAAIPWAATLSFKLGWEPHTDLPRLISSPFASILSVERWRFVGLSFARRFDPVGGFAQWGVVWTLAAIALLLGLRARAWRPRPLRFLLLVVAGCWAAWLGIFLATPLDVAWHVRTALDRLMLQLLPLTLMTGFASVALALGAPGRDRPATAPAAPTPDRPAWRGAPAGS